MTFGVGYGLSLFSTPPVVKELENLVWSPGIAKRYFNYRRNWNVYYGILAVYFPLMLAVLFAI